LTSLADITGYAPLPPIYSFGFHFSKWAPISAESMMERDKYFETLGFPVDVHWLDIPFSEGYQYFKFNETAFPPDQLSQLNQQIEGHNRYLVTINNPHIKASEEYSVFKNGLDLERQSRLI
jgi:alpha-glucosidase (family GH31 glycosyl hydrolase)